jgi:hypothetical protein
VCYAVKMEAFVIVIVVIVFLMTYFFFNKAEIPIQAIEVSASKMISSLAETREISQYTFDTSLTLEVSFPIYIVALFAFIGWWFFVIYAGVGLPALPIDLILEFLNRPIRMKESQFIQHREALARDLVALKNTGEQIEKDNAVAKNTEGCMT